MFEKQISSVKNFAMDLKELGCEDVDWIHLDHDRVQWWASVNFHIP
jgi:hypothetical protein